MIYVCIQDEENVLFGCDAKKAELIFSSWNSIYMYMNHKGTAIYEDIDRHGFKNWQLQECIAYEEAWTLLVHRCFTYYDPATLKDAAYFFKRSQASVKSVLGEDLASYMEEG